MSETQSATPRQARLMGALAAAIGLYLSLVGFGVLPIPGGSPRNLHAPSRILLLVGLLFCLAGTAVFLQVIGRANAGGALPTDAPFWIRVAQYLLGVTMYLSFAVLGSWVALTGQSQHFSGRFLIFDPATTALIARSAFGIGAIITWLATIAFAVSGARKLLRREKD